MARTRKAKGQVRARSANSVNRSLTCRPAHRVMRLCSLCGCPYKTPVTYRGQSPAPNDDYLVILDASDRRILRCFRPGNARPLPKSGDTGNWPPDHHLKSRFLTPAGLSLTFLASRTTRSRIGSFASQRFNRIDMRGTTRGNQHRDYCRHRQTRSDGGENPGIRRTDMVKQCRK